MIQKYPEIFITGTDTDIGKTVISASLCNGLEQLGFPTTYGKPVQSGDSHPDINVVREWAIQTSIIPSFVSLKAPLSPDQLAESEGTLLPTMDTYLKSFPQPSKGLTVWEGAGGLLVPITPDRETWLDLFDQKRDLDLILVARSGLGTINHTSLTIEALAQKGLSPKAIVLNGKHPEKNIQSLESMYPNLEGRFISYPELDFEKNQFCKQSRLLAEKVMTLVTEDTQRNQEWTELDRKHCWHPYTQHKGFNPLAIKRASGVWLYDEKDNKYLDATSSWWVNTIGHGNPKIGAALANQQSQLDHIIFAGHSHKPAAKLATKIIDLANSQLAKVFFTDNGSCAVEVGMKMAIQSFYNQGIKRSKFLTLKAGYHGDTFGTMWVGGSTAFHSMFSYESSHIQIEPCTSHNSIHTPNIEDHKAIDRRLEDLKKILKCESDSIAGFVLEPLVQGAGGMLVHNIPWLKKVVALVQSYGIPIILDEVFSGMGRVGGPFAFQKLGIQPDIVCLAKGLTGGAFPLALTLATDRIFNSFLGTENSKALYHGHSFTANAIGCQAALACLDIYEDQKLFAKGQVIEDRFKDWLESDGANLGVSNPRALGAVLAFEIPGTGPGDYFHPKRAHVTPAGLQYGLALRPLGNTIYLVPPLTITQNELSTALGSLTKAVATINKERT